MRCGHDLIIGGNFMLSDICGEELNEDDDAMVTKIYPRKPTCFSGGMNWAWLSDC